MRLEMKRLAPGETPVERSIIDHSRVISAAASLLGRAIGSAPEVDAALVGVDRSADGIEVAGTARQLQC